MAKKKLYPNIVRGGVAIPIPNMPNYYYLAGKTHAQGGIDIGSNPKTGLEAEDKEVIKLEPKSIKVYSAQRFLGGNSPAELVMKGKNPDSVFKAQEDFKDRNNLNDDGTKKAKYGKKAAVVRTPEDEKVSKLTRSYYKEINPLAGYPGVGDAIKHALNVFGRRYVETENTAYPVTDKVADATWRKRLGLSYNEADLPSNVDGSVRLPKDRELEIPVDTNLLKNRINANQKLSKKYEDANKLKSKKVVDWAIGEDEAALNALRKTYKTGQPVVVNEQAYNSRSLIKNDEVSMPGSSPLNPLQNYTLQYDKDRNVMMYRDVYDFNHLDWAVPGKGYKIQGEIDLNKKAMGGKTNKPVTVTANGKTKVIYYPSMGNTRSEAKGNRIKGELGLIQPITKYNSLLETPLINDVTSKIVPKHLSYKTDRLPLVAIPKVNNTINMTQPVVSTVTSKNPVGSQQPMKTKKASFINNVLDFVGENKNLVNDGISLIGNVTGSLLSNSTNKKTLNKLKYGPIPTPRTATKLKTNININPQLDKMTRTLEAYERNIDANTASSRVVLARKNRLRSDAIAEYNTLLANKENQETQLINQDRLNRQNITNQNIADYNSYLINKDDFKNKVTELKGDNKVNLINNLNSAIQNVITTGEKRRKDMNSLISIIAANPNVNPQLLKDLGFDGITQDMIDRINKNRKG